MRVFGRSWKRSRPQRSECTKRQSIAKCSVFEAKRDCAQKAILEDRKTWMLDLGRMMKSFQADFLPIRLNVHA